MPAPTFISMIAVENVNMHGLTPFGRHKIHFLYYFLTSPVGQSRIKLYVNGAAQPNLGAKSVAKYKLTLPKPDEHKTIVQKLDGLRAETQRLEALYLQKLAVLTALKKSLLHQAFNGEL
jgi:type I restriction enzyme S subunit